MQFDRLLIKPDHTQWKQGMSLLWNDCLSFAHSPTAAYVACFSLLQHQTLLVENPVHVRNAHSYYPYITFRPTSLGKNITGCPTFVVFLSCLDKFHQLYGNLGISNSPQLFSASGPALSFVSLHHNSKLLVLIMLAIFSQLTFFVKTEAKEIGFDKGSFLYFPCIIHFIHL